MVFTGVVNMLHPASVVNMLQPAMLQPAMLQPAML